MCNGIVLFLCIDMLVNRVLPKVDHLGIDARIVLEQNKLEQNKFPVL